MLAYRAGKRIMAKRNIENRCRKEGRDHEILYAVLLTDNSDG